MRGRSIIVLFVLLLCSAKLFAQIDTSRVIYAHIYHGWKVKRAYRGETGRSLGGLLGGHVVIQVGEYDYGYNFTSSRVHWFARQRKSLRVGVLEKESASGTAEAWRRGKVTTVRIPVSKAQYEELKTLADAYHNDPPFDYAFFGMRCAATGYYLLGRINVFHHASHTRSICKAFYPKAFRKKILRLAKKRGYTVTVQPGDETRKWEGD